MYYEIRDPEGKILISNIPAGARAFSACRLGRHEGKLSDGTFCRYGRSQNHDGSVFLLVTDGPAFQSKAAFTEKLRMYAQLTDTVREMRAQMLDEFSHDLIELTGKNAYEVYSVLDQVELGAKPTFADQMSYAESAINSKSEDTANALLQILRNSALIKSVVVGLESKYYSRPNLTFKEHLAREVLANVLLPFMRDFDKKGISVVLEQQDAPIHIDYRTFTAALCPIVEDAAKYSLPDTKFFIRVKRSDAVVIIEFDMLSLTISPDEVEKIFTEGYSGRAAVELQIKGKGLGLYMAKRLLGLNNATISCEAAVTPERTRWADGHAYERNIIKVAIAA